jgi:hypothetical protein
LCLLGRCFSQSPAPPFFFTSVIIWIRFHIGKWSSYIHLPHS